MGIRGGVKKSEPHQVVGGNVEATLGGVEMHW